MIFSIGHSTHERDEFVKLVRGIDVIVDVRSHPTSRWPQWRCEAMQLWLPAAGLRYEWIKGLGGWDTEHARYADAMANVSVDLSAYAKGVFPKQRIGRQVDRQPGQRCADLDPPQWTNLGLFDYAWYTTTDEFRDGMVQLIERYAGRDKPNAAILCCEALWWKCHRSMIADVLVALGHDCFHLPPRLPVRETTPRWKAHTSALGNRLQRYDGRILPTWNAIIPRVAA